jgi:hypothetical protein
MAIKASLGRILRPLSINHVGGFTGANSKRLAAFVPLMIQDYTYFMDDFTSPVLDTTNHWLIATDGGSTAFAAGALAGGTIRGVTEAASGDFIGIKTTVIFDAALKPGAMIRWKDDVVTTFKYEFGFSDPLSDDTLLALNDIDTPTITNGATDVLVIARDTGQTLTTAALVADGTTGSAAKTDFSAVAIPTAATYTHMLVQAGVNHGYGIIDNNVGFSANTTQGPDTAILLQAHFTLGTLSAAHTVDIDYIAYWQERS